MDFSKFFVKIFSNTIKFTFAKTAFSKNALSNKPRDKGAGTEIPLLSLKNQNFLESDKKLFGLAKFFWPDNELLAQNKVPKYGTI